MTRAWGKQVVAGEEQVGRVVLQSLLKKEAQASQARHGSKGIRVPDRKSRVEDGGGGFGWACSSGAACPGKLLQGFFRFTMWRESLRDA